MARAGESVGKSIEEICSKYYKKYFSERNRYETFNIDCGCDGCSCCKDSGRKVKRPQKQPLCRSVSKYGGLPLHEEDDSSGMKPVVARNRRIYPKEETAVYRRMPSVTKSTIRDDCYEGVRKPYILIINNVNFHTMPAPRGGAEADVENLMEFFKDSGFTSIVDRYDLSRHEMLQQLEETRKNPALLDHDAFICVIMTHGDAHGLKGVDERSIEVEQITSLFVGDNCPQLMTKPKLFFIQACRGDRADKGYIVPQGDVTDSVDKEIAVKLPSEADMLVAYSTTKNHVSYRKFTDIVQAMVEQRQMMGSWFISCMVQVFKEHSHREDLMTMLAKVNRTMAELYTGGDPQSGYKQISCQLSMLTKRLYFAKYWQQQEELFSEPF